MSTVILKGDEAIHYADVHGMTLNKYATDATKALEGISVKEAQAIADDDPSLVWIEIHKGVNSSDVD